MNGFDLITQGPRAFGVAALIALASPQRLRTDRTQNSLLPRAMK